MQPYYQDTTSTLYLGDCRELVPALQLPRIGLLLSDPPYGVGWDTDYHRNKQSTSARWCIQQARHVQTVLDSFAGSGWVLKAAKTLGRRAWGVEIVEQYAEMAAGRPGARVAQEAAP